MMSLSECRRLHVCVRARERGGSEGEREKFTYQVDLEVNEGGKGEKSEVFQSVLLVPKCP